MELNTRQRAILSLLVAGYRTAEIAKILNCEPSKINYGIRQIMEGFGVRNRPALVYAVCRKGIIKL